MPLPVSIDSGLLPHFDLTGYILFIFLLFCFVQLLLQLELLALQGSDRTSPTLEVNSSSPKRKKWFFNTVNIVKLRGGV